MRLLVAPSPNYRLLASDKGIQAGSHLTNNRNVREMQSLITCKIMTIIDATWTGKEEVSCD